MKRTLLALTVVAAVCAARPASAATIVFDVCNTPSLCNQISMTTSLNAGAIDVLVGSDSTFGIFGDSGANHALGFNVVGSELGLSITGLTSGFAFGGTDGAVNGYGFFEYLIDGPHVGAGAVLPLEFTVSRTGGFLSDLDLFETNSLGYIAAAHARNNDTGLTGFVATEHPPENNTPVPEPATMVLVGTGLLAAMRHRRRQA